MKRFLAILAVTLAAIFALVALRHGQQARREAKPATSIPVQTALARRADVALTIDGIGTVQALNTVNIRPMVSGPLTAILFREGQEVHKGDVLARIDPRTYQAAYDQAVAKKAQDEAILANAKLDLARYVKLARTQYTTAQQADTQRATVAEDAAQVAQDQAQIETAKTNLSYTNITAPVDGRTGIRQVDLGNIVTSADTVPLTVVTTLHPIAVLFTLPQQSLAEVMAAMQAGRASGGPVVLALPQDGVEGGGAPLDEGHVSVVDNEVDQNTGTIKLKAIFPNPKLTLWPGAFVNVRLALRVDHNVITVPVGAVQRGPQGAYVFTLDGKPTSKTPGPLIQTALRVPVTVARQTDSVAVISAGLSPGEPVVTDGASRLTDGSRVRVLAAGGDG